MTHEIKPGSRWYTLSLSGNPIVATVTAVNGETVTFKHYRCQPSTEPLAYFLENYWPEIQKPAHVEPEPAESYPGLFD